MFLFYFVIGALQIDHRHHQVASWCCGRVSDSRSRGRGFKSATPRRHLVVSSAETLLFRGSAARVPLISRMQPRHDRCVDGIG